MDPVGAYPGTVLPYPGNIVGLPEDLVMEIGLRANSYPNHDMLSLGFGYGKVAAQIQKARNSGPGLLYICDLAVPWSDFEPLMKWWGCNIDNTLYENAFSLSYLNSLEKLGERFSVIITKTWASPDIREKEYAWSWAHICQGGLLVAKDWDYKGGKAWTDFVKSVGKKLLVKDEFAYLVKT